MWKMNAEGRMEYVGAKSNEPLLTPGANVAKQRGCTCSRLDNDWGWGTVVPSDSEEGASDLDIEYVVTPGCPLHDTRAAREDEREATSDSTSEGLDRSDERDESLNGLPLVVDRSELEGGSSNAGG